MTTPSSGARRRDTAKSGKSGTERANGGLAAAVASGRLEGLRALRDALAGEIETGPVGEKAVSQTAALARQLREVLKEVAELEKLSPKKSVVDDLARRRTARRAGAKGAASAAGDRQ